MSDFFVSLSDRSLALLAQAEIRRSFSAGSVLFLEETDGTHVYRLRSGSIRLYKSQENGRESTVRMIRPGELFAEIVLFERDAFPVSAVAMVDAEVSMYPRSRVLGLLEERGFREDFIRSLAAKLRYLSQQVSNVSTLDVDQRLARFLEDRFGRRAVIEIDMSKHDVATALSIRPETLSRVLRRLEERGIFEWEKRTIRVSGDFWDADR